MTTNKFTSQIIEFHILQSFPVTCLNRDDVGSPKSAIIGGVQRARVSSQCWKRQVRLAMHDTPNIGFGFRTKRVKKLIVDACYEKLKSQQLEITEEQEKNIDALGHHVSKLLDDKSSADDKTGEFKTSTLIFISNSDARRIADTMFSFNFSLSELETQLNATQENLKKAKKDKNKERTISFQEEKNGLEKIKNILALLNDFNAIHDGIDIVLFGRMVANAASMNIEAAASFSHAISTHKVSSEVEFFTAVADPLSDDEPPIQGSAHMGSLEFSSATYYRYISLNLGQLYDSLAGQSMPAAIEAFTKALFIAVPEARQTTMSGASPWDFAKVFVRKGQRLQVAFEKPVSKEKDGGFLQPSIDALTQYLAKKEKLHGSLFGKQAEYTFGEDENFSIDDLVAALKKHVEV